MKEKILLIGGGVWVGILTIMSVFLYKYFVILYSDPLIVILWGISWLAGCVLTSWAAWAGEFLTRRKTPFRCPFFKCNFKSKSLLTIHKHLLNKHRLEMEKVGFKMEG